jgi:hypothetical protein
MRSILDSDEHLLKDLIKGDVKITKVKRVTSIITQSSLLIYLPIPTRDEQCQLHVFNMAAQVALSIHRFDKQTKMRFYHLLAFSAPAHAFYFALVILAPTPIRDAIVGSGKVTSDGEVEPLTRETQDPSSEPICLDKAGKYSGLANPSCDYGDPVSGVFTLSFSSPHDEPRPFNITIGDDPTMMMVGRHTGYKAYIDAVSNHGSGTRKDCLGDWPGISRIPGGSSR